MMKKFPKDKLTLIASVCAIICSVWTIVAAVFVIRSGGSVNAGYALIPCMFTVTFNVIVTRRRAKDNKKHEQNNVNNNDNEAAR